MRIIKKIDDCKVGDRVRLIANDFETHFRASYRELLLATSGTVIEGRIGNDFKADIVILDNEPFVLHPDTEVEVLI